jgi:hypothetical protein
VYGWWKNLQLEHVATTLVDPAPEEGVVGWSGIVQLFFKKMPHQVPFSGKHFFFIGKIEL